MPALLGRSLVFDKLPILFFVQILVRIGSHEIVVFIDFIIEVPPCARRRGRAFRPFRARSTTTATRPSRAPTSFRFRLVRFLGTFLTGNGITKIFVFDVLF